MELLIDGDLVAYRAAASAEGEEEHVAIARTEATMETIFGGLTHSAYSVYLTGRLNFRRTIYPLYKANRIQPKPRYLDACKDYLMAEHNAEMDMFLEADDLLGIKQSENPGETCIVSIDKDLRQIPGLHYNWVKNVVDEVDEYTGWFNFYRQFLIGDVSDNIIGVQGIGEKKAEKQLYGLEPDEMFDRVRELYNDDRRMLTNGQCLYILREKYKTWAPEQLQHLLTGPNLFDFDAATQLLFSQIKEEQTSPLSVPIVSEESGLPVDGI